VSQDDESVGTGLEPLDAAEFPIRKVQHEGQWYFSVVDTVAALTESKAPQQYWRDMKRRMTDEGWIETQAKCLPLKMPAADGKQRLTDAADIETLLRIIQAIPSPHAEPVRQWLARVGAERLEEMENPALAADRMRKEYQRMGYTDEWVNARLQNIVARNELVAEWAERGAEQGHEYAILTDVLHRGTFDVSTAQHKVIKGLKRQNLQDNMTPIELVLSSLAEVTATAMHQQRDSEGFMQLQRDAKEAGEVGGAARRDIEARLGQPVVSPENAKTLRQGRRHEMQPPLFAEHPAKNAPTAPPAPPTDHENGD
jgi:hypothetical protein